MFCSTNFYITLKTLENSIMELSLNVSNFLKFIDDKKLRF